MSEKPQNKLFHYVTYNYLQSIIIKCTTKSDLYNNEQKVYLDTWTAELAWSIITWRQVFRTPRCGSTTLEPTNVLLHNLNRNSIYNESYVLTMQCCVFLIHVYCPKDPTAERRELLSYLIQFIHEPQVLFGWASPHIWPQNLFF